MEYLDPGKQRDREEAMKRAETLAEAVSSIVMNACFKINDPEMASIVMEKATKLVADDLEEFYSKEDALVFTNDVNMAAESRMIEFNDAIQKFVNDYTMRLEQSTE